MKRMRIIISCGQIPRLDHMCSMLGWAAAFGVIESESGHNWLVVSRDQSIDKSMFLFRCV